MRFFSMFQPLFFKGYIWVNFLTPPLKSSTAIFSGSTPFEPPQVYRTPLESVLSDLWRCFEAKWHFFCYFQAIFGHFQAILACFGLYSLYDRFFGFYEV